MDELPSELNAYTTIRSPNYPGRPTEEFNHTCTFTPLNHSTFELSSLQVVIVNGSTATQYSVQPQESLLRLTTVEDVVSRRGHGRNFTLADITASQTYHVFEDPSSLLAVRPLVQFSMMYKQGADGLRFRSSLEGWCRHNMKRGLQDPECFSKFESCVLFVFSVSRTQRVLLGCVARR